MVEKKVRVEFEEGLHMRPAGLLAAEMSQYSSRVTLISGSSIIDAKSILSIMAAAIKYGTVITVECEGDDEQSALDSAVDLISCKNK